MSHWTDKLVKMHACEQAVEWARDYKTLAAAWRACQRGDWMLWLIGRTDRSDPWSEERKPLVRVALACAHLAPWSEDETTLARVWCLDAIARWLEGEAKPDEVEAARSAVADAYDDAYDAAYDAAYAAYAYAAAYAADVAAQSQVLRQVADIVREHYPQPRLRR